MRKQDHAETWVIGDYCMYVTHFEDDEYYEWTVTYSPMGYSHRGQSISLELAIRNMLDTAENHSGGVLLETYHFDIPGADIDIECTPQSSVQEVFQQVLEKGGLPINLHDWTLESSHGIPIDNLSLHIGIFSQGIIAYTNGTAI